MGATETHTLSERASKELLMSFGVPIAAEQFVDDPAAAVAAAEAIGYPVVLKLNGDAIAHKTERGLVRLDVSNAAAVEIAAAALLDAVRPEDGDVNVLVAPMVKGNREFIVGALRDPQFGPTVMLGVGGVFAEAIADVVFRPAPLDAVTAGEMIDDLATAKLLGAFRGEAEVDRDALAAALIGIGRVIAERDDIASIDVNPFIVTADGSPVAVDALVELRRSPALTRAAVERRSRPTPEQFSALFEPKGVLVAGASTHPGKFGFVSLHNLLASGYAGRVFGTNLQGEEVLGIRTVADIADIPDGEADLVFVWPASRPNVSSSRWLTSWGSCSPDRTVRASSAHPRRCAPRSSPRIRLPGASA